MQALKARAVWAVPIAVGLATYGLSERRLTELLVVALGAALLAAACRRPVFALVGLSMFLPIEPVGLPFLYQAGLSATAVRGIGAFKELMALGLVIAAANAVLTERRRLDRLDVAVLAYIGVVTLELVVPGLFTTHAPVSLHVRLLAWRDDCGYAAILLAVRHARLSKKDRRRFTSTITVLAAFLAAVAFYQRIDRTGFNHFVVKTINLPSYQAAVQHLPAQTIGAGLYNLTDSRPLRVTSLLLYPFSLGDYMVVVVAILAERLVRSQRRPWATPVLIASLATIYLTEVRGDLLAAGLVLLAALLPAAGRSLRGRRELALLIFVVGLVALPALGNSRYLGGQGASASNSIHSHEFTTALSTFEHNPLGLGLGNQPTTANRFNTLGANAQVGDNSLLQVGTELGIQALVPWLIMIIVMLERCLGRRRVTDPMVMGAGMALVGLLIAGQTHPAFVSYAAPWTLMAAIGLATRSHTSQDDVAPMEVLTA